LELRQNKLTGSDFAEIARLYPNLYKLKVGQNPIKDLSIFKPFASAGLKKLELADTDAAKKGNYREELFKMLKDLEVIDGLNKEGDEIDSTLYDEDDEGDELDYEGDDGDFDDEEGDFEDDEDFDEDEEEEDEKPQRGKKQRKD
jgi:hypothetical protein